MLFFLHMKATTLINQRHIGIFLVAMLLIMTGFRLSASVKAESPITAGHKTGSLVANEKLPPPISNLDSNLTTIPDKTVNHSTLSDESRGLSGFFILGILINILMVITFAWWFSKEWRKSRNRN